MVEQKQKRYRPKNKKRRYPHKKNPMSVTDIEKKFNSMFDSTLDKLDLKTKNEKKDKLKLSKSDNDQDIRASIHMLAKDLLHFKRNVNEKLDLILQLLKNKRS